MSKVKFQNQRFITKNANELIPIEIQAVLFSMIDSEYNQKKKLDYLQTFIFSKEGDCLVITKKQEVPRRTTIIKVPYRSEYQKILCEKLFIIDSMDYSTFLLASEY